MLTRIQPFIAALLMLVFVTSSGNAATPPGPLVTVQQASDRIIGILSDPSVPREERWTRIAPIIAESFDFLAMSKSILAQRWPSATPVQQRQFVDFFSQYIEGTYRSKIEAYSGQRIEYKGEKIRGERAAVDSVIHTDATSIPISYFLRQAGNGQWKVYDVMIEGVSLVNNYRETYAAIARSSGISGVLARVKARAKAVAAATPASSAQ